MNSSLSIYFAPTLFSNSFFSPRAHRRVATSLGIWKVLRVPSSRAWRTEYTKALALPWQPTVTQVPCGAQNLNEVVQAQTQGTLTPSVWLTGDPSSPQCHTMRRRAFKDMNPLCHSCPWHTERGSPVEEGALTQPCDRYRVRKGKAPAGASAQVQRQAT